MRNTRDTFLHFLSDNLVGIPVRGVWRSPNVPDGDLIQNNSVNVTFLDGTFSTHVSKQLCMIDVVNSDELTAIDWTDTLWALLSLRCFTPQLDNTIPSAPVPTGSNVMWPMSNIRFTPIKDDYYFRYSCRLALQNQS